MVVLVAKLEVLIEEAVREEEEVARVVVRAEEMVEVVAEDDVVEVRLNVDEFEPVAENATGEELRLVEERLLEVIVTMVVDCRVDVLLVFKILDEVAGELEDEVEDEVVEDHVELLDWVVIELLDDREVVTEDMLKRMVAGAEILVEEELKVVGFAVLVEELEVMLLVALEAENW